MEGSRVAERRVDEGSVDDVGGDESSWTASIWTDAVEELASALSVLPSEGTRAAAVPAEITDPSAMAGTASHYTAIHTSGKASVGAE